MKKICICSILALFCCTLTAKADTTITSPDGQISVNLKTGAEGLGWTVSRAGKQVYSETNVTVNIGGKVLGGTAKVKSIKQRSAQETIRPVVPLKFAEINDSYNEATLNFGSYQMLLRVMNNGVAHRFVLNEKGDVEVMDEKFNLRPAEGFTAHYQTCGSFNTSYEEAYQSKSIGEWEQDGKTATIPCLLSNADDTQLLIGESDVDDYPRMFLKAENGTVTTTFPKAPIKWEPRGDRGENITQEADYIAKTSGRRALPWRWVAVTDSKGIIEQTIPVQLARRSALGDTSWIKPGKFS